MDRDLQDYYESLLGLFGAEGWQTFMADQEEAFQHLTLSAARDCSDNDAWQYRRGYLAALNQTITFEESIRNSYDNLEQEGAIDAQWEEVVH